MTCRHRPRPVARNAAGPVRGRRAELTNLPWCVDADELDRHPGGRTAATLRALDSGRPQDTALQGLRLEGCSVDLQLDPRATVRLPDGSRIRALNGVLDAPELLWQGALWKTALTFVTAAIAHLAQSTPEEFSITATDFNS